MKNGKRKTENGEWRKGETEDEAGPIVGESGLRISSQEKKKWKVGIADEENRAEMASGEKTHVKQVRARSEDPTSLRPRGSA